MFSDARYLLYGRLGIVVEAAEAPPPVDPALRKTVPLSTVMPWRCVWPSTTTGTLPASMAACLGSWTATMKGMGFWASTSVAILAASFACVVRRQGQVQWIYQRGRAWFQFSKG